MQSRQLRSIALAATGAAILAHGALAAGEPKNEPPFTRPVNVRTLARASQPAIASPQIRGEPKNEPPFTNKAGLTSQYYSKAGSPTVGQVGGVNYHARAEAKDEKQVTGSGQAATTPATVIVSSRSGFSFTDGAIGALAGIGIALSAGAALALTRRSPRTA